jgi:hypothetical protein
VCACLMYLSVVCLVVNCLLLRVGAVRVRIMCFTNIFNPLNAELNPICHLLALLGAHHILHVSRIKVNNLEF